MKIAPKLRGLGALIGEGVSVLIHEGFGAGDHISALGEGLV